MTSTANGTPPLHVHGSSLSAVPQREQAEDAIGACRTEYGTRGWAMNSLCDGIGPLLADLRSADIRLTAATSTLELIARCVFALVGLDPSTGIIHAAPVDELRRAPGV